MNQSETETSRERSDILSGPQPPQYSSVILEPAIRESNRESLRQNISTKTLPFKKDQDLGFNITFVKRLHRLHKLLFVKLCSVSSALFFLLLFLVILREYVVYNVGLIASGFYVALGNKDQKLFWEQTGKSMGLILAVTVSNSITDYIRSVLTATFRKILTEAAHRLYFADTRYYQMNVLDKAIDNPDQRMTQDIDKFCSVFCNALPKLLVSPFTIGYYCYQGAERSGWQGPVGCFTFFVVATTVNKLLMGPVIHYVVKQEKCEGDFRFCHMLVRVYSESIAFQEGSVLEHEKVNASLNKLVDTQRSLYFRQFFLSFSTNFADYIGSIFSYLMLAIPVFSGEYDNLTPIELSSLISQNAFVLIYLIFSFTSVVDLSINFTDVAGATHRIAQLLERLNAIEDFWRKKKSDDNNQGSIVSCDMLDQWSTARKHISQRLEGQTQEESENPKNAPRIPIWSLENVTIFRPKENEPMISNLNFQFTVGESVIITGTSGAGKSSIFRVLRGLWLPEDGSLKCHHPPGPQGVYFSPQKAYLTWGTIREQISFPLFPDTKKMNDQLILSYIDKLKLSPIVNRVGGLDLPCSWSVYDSLSPGEMQRFCLLRIFYHQPVVAVLDEVTSSLSLDMEKFVYSELKHLGITLISVGHRESIRKYHDKMLIIDSKGGWNVRPIVATD